MADTVPRLNGTQRTLNRALTTVRLVRILTTYKTSTYFKTTLNPMYYIPFPVSTRHTDRLLSLLASTKGLVHFTNLFPWVIFLSGCVQGVWWWGGRGTGGASTSSPPW